MDKALATQLANIEKRTGKTLDAAGSRSSRRSGLTKHGEIRDMLKTRYRAWATATPTRSCTTC